MKQCPFCTGLIQDEAVKCDFCGSMLNGGPQNPPPQTAPQQFAPPGMPPQTAPQQFAPLQNIPQQGSSTKTAASFAAGWGLLLASGVLLWLAYYRLHAVLPPVGLKYFGDQFDSIGKLLQYSPYRFSRYTGIGEEKYLLFTPIISIMIYVAAMFCGFCAAWNMKKANSDRGKYGIWGYIGFIIFLTLLYLCAPVLVATVIFVVVLAMISGMDPAGNAPQQNQFMVRQPVQNQFQPVQNQFQPARNQFQQTPANTAATAGVRKNDPRDRLRRSMRNGTGTPPPPPQR